MAAAGVKGLPRKLDSLERAAVAKAKLKLKNVADVEEATEVMQFFNVMLSNFAQTVALTKNPRDVTVEEICKVVRELNGIPIAYVEAAKEACKRNEQVKYYLGDILELSKNWKLENILILIRKNQFIETINEKPIVLRWKRQDYANESKVIPPDTVSKESDNTLTKELLVDSKRITREINHSSGVCGEYEVNQPSAPENVAQVNDHKNLEGVENGTSHASYTQDNKYSRTVDLSSQRLSNNKSENRSQNERLFSCPHCYAFTTYNEIEYQHHIVIKHPAKPAYPWNTTGE